MKTEEGIRRDDDKDRPIPNAECCDDGNGGGGGGIRRYSRSRPRIRVRRKYVNQCSSSRNNKLVQFGCSFVSLLLYTCCCRPLLIDRGTIFCGIGIVVAAETDAIRPPTSSEEAKGSRLRGKEAVNIELEKERREEEEEEERAVENKKKLVKIFKKAGKRGLGGGIPGACAGVVQVLSLMWIRTVINYQYRYGTTFKQAIRTLKNQGGVRRFYRGVGFALVQNPLAKFGSTFANDGIAVLMESFEYTKMWGPGRATFVSSIVVGLWRIFLMPIDTCKTVLQVDSDEGFRALVRKVRCGKFGILYQGALANAVSAIFSYYPWFYTYNLLMKNEWLKQAVQLPLLRNAGVGFVSSVVSDIVSNFVRVIKTTKQAMATKHVVSYGEAISMVLAADGIQGLFGRGLKARVIGNAIQSVVFTVVWRGLADVGLWGTNGGADKNDKEEEGDDDR